MERVIRPGSEKAAWEVCEVRVKRNVGTGILFSKAAHSDFNALTGSRFHSMVSRLEKKKMGHPPFSLEQFRSYVLKALGGKEDGVIRCRYCMGWFSLIETAVDHAKPLSRGGSAGLENLEYPCKSCNDRKGSMSPDEYLALLAFLETIPLARIDVLKRLEQSVKLAAGARRNAMLRAGKLPQRKQQPADDGMPEF